MGTSRAGLLCTLSFWGLSEGRVSRCLAPSQPRAGRPGGRHGGKMAVGFGPGGRRDDRRGDLQSCIALNLMVSLLQRTMLPAVGLISAVRPTVPTRVYTAAGNRLRTGSIMPRVFLHGACVPRGCRGRVGTPVRTPSRVYRSFRGAATMFLGKQSRGIAPRGLGALISVFITASDVRGAAWPVGDGRLSIWKSTSALRDEERRTLGLGLGKPSAVSKQANCSSVGVSLFQCPSFPGPTGSNFQAAQTLEPHPTAAFDAANLRFIKSYQITKTQLLRAMPLHLIPPAP